MSLTLRTKGDLVKDALSKMRISGITAPPEAEDSQLLIERLEGIIYELDGRGICLDYNFTTDPDPGDFHGMEFYAFQPISSMLAVRTMADFALDIEPGLMLAARAGITTLSNRVGRNKLRQVPYPARHPRGSGNTQRYIRWRTFYPEVNQTSLDCPLVRLVTGEVEDFTESWASYLERNEELSNVLIEVSDGLEVVSSSVNSDRVDYRIRALVPENSYSSERLQFTATTSTGRIDIREKAYEVNSQAQNGGYTS